MALQSAIIASLRERLNLVTAEPERLSLLCRLCSELSPTRPEEALSEIRDALHLAKRLNRREEEALLRRLRGDSALKLERYSEARVAYQRSAELYEQMGDNESAIASALAQAEAAVRNEAYVEGVAAYEKVLALHQELHDSVGVIGVLKTLGDLHADLKDYARAFDYFLRALKIAELLEDSVRIGDASSDLGIICVRLEKYDQALSFFNRALTEFREAEMPLLEVRALVNVAALHAEQKNIESALEHLLKALVIYDVLGDKVGLAATLLNVGDLHERNNRPESALDLYHKALDLFEELSDNLGRGAALLGIGNVYRKIGRNHDAAWFLEHALRAAIENSDPEREARSRELLAHTLDSLGDYSGSLRHLWKYLELLREQTNSEQQKIIAEMQVRFDLEQAEKEREIWKLKTEQLEGEMNRKAAELTALTLQLVEKHRFIEELLRKIESIEDGASEDIKPIAQELTVQMKRNIAGGNDWRVFEEQFQNVHPDLLHRIASRWPTLSPAELRICALIITGLSISEIADLLCINVRSVETNRYRIRKKLEIDSKTNLATFLQGV